MMLSKINPPGKSVILLTQKARKGKAIVTESRSVFAEKQRKKFNHKIRMKEFR